jgi:hypothetical protein
MLEELTQGGLRNSQPQPDDTAELRTIHERLAEVENELDNLKHKNNTMAKFRRDLSPQQAESTKEMSADANRQ